MRLENLCIHVFIYLGYMFVYFHDFIGHLVKMPMHFRHIVI